MGVTTLGAWAFASCTSVTNIYVPDGVSVFAYRRAGGWG
jgi:hypothetical protein